MYTSFLLNRELSAIAQKGEPISNTQALPQAIPLTQNAAPLYQQAVDKSQLKPSLDCDDLSDQEITEILDKNTQVIDLVYQATAKPQCQFPLSQDEEYGGLAPAIDLKKLRNLAVLLEIQAHKDAESGNKTNALQNVQRQFVMAKHVAEMPTLYCALLARSLQNTANRTLAKVLLGISITPSEAREWEASLPQIDWRPYLHNVLLTERVININYHEHLLNDVHFTMRQYLKANEAYSLRLWREIIKKAKNAPTPVPLDYTKKLDERTENAPWYAMTAMMLTHYNRVMINDDYIKTQDRMREIAFALAAYRSHYHKYPSTLELAEEFWKSTFPNDIFSQKSFRYKSDGKTFLLYSVGRNGKDDGGIWRSSYDETISKDDLAWKNNPR